ncbi:MAG: amidohydrolase, partial [Intestinibacter sp.]|nr:amidohydrolase [Intestinibacter sp.]
MLKDNVVKRGNEILDYLIDIRRDIHRTPELAMEEFVTKNKIKKYLDEIGIDYMEFEHHRGIMA